MPESLKGKDPDWGRFKELVSYHELYSYLYPMVKEQAGFFPGELIGILENSHFYYLMYNQKLMREFSLISSAFAKSGVSVVPLKGASFLNDIYSDIAPRPMSDIDLLVEKEDLSAAGEILSSLGFSERLDGLGRDYWLKKQCHLQFVRGDDDKKQLKVDLHFGLDFERGSLVLPGLWERVSGGMLSPEDSLFCLALHQRRFGKTLCLKNVIDAGLILKKYREALDWDYLLDQAGRGRMRSSLFFLFAQAREVFGEDIHISKAESFCPSRIKRRLVTSFIKRNIFSGSLEKRNKSLYLRMHFLLYDNFIEPVLYVMNIPREQFAKFYGLDPNSENTKSLYRKRIAYILYRSVSGLFKGA